MRAMERSPNEIWTDDDRRLMRLALALARRGAGKTRPNPAVGAVICAPDGQILGRGFHRRAGMPHAEVEALRDCERRGHSAAGASIYVTLEPCNHHGRTPPCTEAILRAGIRRVIVAARDPNRRVRGGGMERLAEGGKIEARWGLFEEEAVEINAGYHYFHSAGRPFVTLKWAMSLDGCTSAASGHARWISGEESRRDAHLLRARHDAVAVGIGTALADDPLLTVRLPRWNGPPPWRIVVDSRLRISETAAIFRENPERVIIAARAPAPVKKARRIEALGARVLEIAPGKETMHSKTDRSRSGGGVALGPLLDALAAMEIQSVFVEGGRRLAGSFFAARLVNRVVIYAAPLLMGSGEGALGGLLVGDGVAVSRAADAVRLGKVCIAQGGQDIRIEGILDWGENLP